MKEDFFPDAQQILDLFHLKENVGKFAQFIFNTDLKKDSYTSDRWCRALEDGKCLEVLAALEPYKGRKVLEGTVNLFNYIVNNQYNIDYPACSVKVYIVGNEAPFKSAATELFRPA